MGGASFHVLRAAGVEMIIAIDSLARGPSLGGCRWRPYADPEGARREARELAAAMTRKAAMARLPLGGGKAVVVGDPAARTRDQLLAFGDFVASLNGDYVTAADMGTGEQQMAVIAEKTEHVVGLPRALGGCGDPGSFTAEGVFLALEAALASRGSSVAGASVAVQGVGSVGGALVRQLLDARARVIAADPNPEQCAGLPDAVVRVAVDEILDQTCDVFAPCGPGRVIDAALASRLRCGVVCGAANNPLADLDVARVLHERGVLYVPDFLANAGGLIHLATARTGGDDAASRENLRVIPANLSEVLERSSRDGIDPGTAAEQIAHERLVP